MEKEGSRGVCIHHRELYGRMPALRSSGLSPSAQSEEDGSLPPAISWQNLPWVKLKTAARLRCIPTQSISGLPAAQKASIKEEICCALDEWYLQRQIESASGPELLVSPEGLLLESQKAGLSFSSHPSDTELDELRRHLVAIHLSELESEEDSDEDEEFEDGDIDGLSAQCADGADGPEAVSEDSDDSESDDEVHEEDIGVLLEPEDSSQSMWRAGSLRIGTKRTVYPARAPGQPSDKRTRAKEDAQSLFGNVIAVHSYVEERSKWCQRRFVVSDFTDESHQYRYSYVVTCLSSGDQFYLSTAAAHLIPTHVQWQDAMEEAVEEKVSISVKAGQPLSSEGLTYVESLKVDLDSDPLFPMLLEHTVVWRDGSSALAEAEVHHEEVDISIGVRRKQRKASPPAKDTPNSGPWMRAGGSKETPMHTQVVNSDEKEIVSKAEALRASLKTGFLHIVNSIERLREPYETPSNTNLVTGEKLDARLTESEKMATLAKSYSCTTRSQGVNSFCVVCSSDAIERRKRNCPQFDPSNPEHVKEALVYGSSPTQKACTMCPGYNGMPQPMHPNPFVPTICYNCGHMLFLGGKVQYACPDCTQSWVLPANASKSLSPCALPENASEASWKRELDERHFQYLRTTGGPSELTGSATSLRQARHLLFAALSSFFEQTLGFRVTPRILLYALLFVFSEKPNGKGGLCLRDFMPRRSRLRSAASRFGGAAAEEADQSNQLWDESCWLASGINESLDNLETWVNKNMEYAPEWPESCRDDDGDDMAGESIMLRSLHNMGRFFTKLGEFRKADIELTCSILEAEINSLHADPSFVFEHKVTLTWYTFGSRTRLQSQDFSIDRRYKFEVGPAIRIFFSNTMPLVLQRIKMPIEQQTYLHAVHSVYGGRFGNGVALSSESESTRENSNGGSGKAVKKKKKGGKNGSSNSGFIESKALSVDLPDILKPINLIAGLPVGDRMPSFRKYDSWRPRDDQNKVVCLNYNTKYGCHPGTLECHESHVYTEQFPYALTRVILCRGGHACWDDLTLDNIAAWQPRKGVQSYLDLLSLQHLHLGEVDLTLEKMLECNTEKRPLQPILQSDGVLHIVPLFDSTTTEGSKSPVQVYTRSGVKVLKVCQKALGKGKSFVEGISFDCGHSIALLNGREATSRCLLISLYSTLRPALIHLHQPGANGPLELAIQVGKALLEIDVHKLPLDSMAAEIYFNCRDPQHLGYSERLFDIIKARMLKNVNILINSQGALHNKDDRSQSHHLFYPAGNSMKKPRESTFAKNKAHSMKFLKTWNWGPTATQSEVASALSTFTSEESSNKHSEGFKLASKQATFSNLCDFFYAAGTHNDCQLRVMSTGSLEELCEMKSKNRYTRAQLIDARACIQSDCRFLEKNSIRDVEANPFLKHADTFLEAADSSAGNTGFAPVPDTSTTLGLFDVPLSTKGEEERRSSCDKHSWRLCCEYMDAVRDAQAKVNMDDDQQVHQTIQDLALLTGKWRNEEIKAPVYPGLTDHSGSPISAGGRMVKMLRYIAFGELRNSEGPEWTDIPDRFKEALSPGHEAAVKELLTHGHSAARLGDKVGYVGETREEALLATQTIFEGFLESMCQWKSLSWLEDEEAELVQDGGRIAPMSSVQKLDDRRRPRINPITLLEKMRSIHDCTDGGAPGAHNTGIWSYRIARQVTTDDQSIVGMLLWEEHYNKGYFIQLFKGDYSGAFAIDGQAIEDFGELGAKHLDVINISSVSTFGPIEGPGWWEVLGSAPSVAVKHADWPDPNSDGELRPKHCRVVDDTIHAVAARGNRQERHWNNFFSQMRLWAGPSCNNEIKAAESGGFTFYQHGFGSLGNSLWRKLSTPFSRLCRCEDKVSEYLKDPNARLTIHQVQSIRSSFDYVLSKWPALKGLIMGRLDNMSGDAALKFGSKIPKDYCPSAAFDGETEAEGDAMVRFGLKSTWVFATVNNGKYLTRSYEQCLEPVYRTAFPGDFESESNIRDFESDASGEGFAMFDPHTGKYFQEWFTPDESEAMFAYDREDHGILITNTEGIPPARLMPLLMAFHDDITVARNRNDNQNMCAANESRSPANVKNIDSIGLMALWSFVSGIDPWLVYVESSKNKRADPATRKPLQKAWLAELKAWEEAHGKAPEKLEVPKLLRCTKTWTRTGGSDTIEARMVDVCTKMEAILDFYELHGFTHKLRMPADQVRECLHMLKTNAPVPLLDRSCEDFPEAMQVSAARQQLSPVEGKVHTDTRAALERKVKRQPNLEAKLRKDAALPKDVHFQEVLNVLMQKQSDKRQVLWEENSNRTSAGSIRHESSVVQIFDLKGDKVKFAEMWMGQGSFSKSIRDCGSGVLVVGAEYNPRSRSLSQKEFPDAEIFEDNSEVTAQVLTDHKVEMVGGGPPCQSHSSGNEHRRGNLDVEGTGTEFEQAGTPQAAFEGKGVAMILKECAVGVHQKAAANVQSPYEQLMENSPGYFDAMQGTTVRAATTKSPLTGEVAPLGGHVRAFVLQCNKLYFPKDARIEIEICNPPRSFSENVREPADCEGRYVMPDEEVFGFQFNYKKNTQSQIAYVGKISKAQKGFGDGAFPPKGWDPKQGLGVTMTTGGAQWMLAEYNGRVVFTQPTPGEMCDAWKLRGIPEELLHPSSEFARFLISHAIVQSVSDAVIVAANHLYLSEMSLEEAASLGFEFKLSPREAFLFHTQGVPPSAARKASSPNGAPRSRSNISSSVSWSKDTKFIDKDTRGKVKRINHSANNSRGPGGALGAPNASVLKLETELKSLDADSGADDDEEDALEEHFNKVSHHNVLTSKWAPNIDSDSELDQTKPNEEEVMAVDQLEQVLKKKRRIDRNHRRVHVRKMLKIQVVDSPNPTDDHSSAANTSGRENAFYAKRASGIKGRNVHVLHATNAHKRRSSLQHNSTEGLAPRITAVKSRGRKSRAKPIVDDEMNSKIDAVIAEAHAGTGQKVHDSNTQHYLDFCEAQGWSTLITAPYSPQQAMRMERYIAYEKAVHGIRGDTIESKLSSVNRFHVDNNLPPPFKVENKASKLLKKLKRGDKPSQPKLPVPKQVIDLEILELGLNDFDTHVKVTAKATGLEICLRSKEYLRADKGSDDRALKWKDLWFKLGASKIMRGKAVAAADRVTASLPSTKNSLGRCTRTIFQTSSMSSAVKLLKSLYLRILCETGSPPSPDDFVFLLQDGSHLSRKVVSKEIQDTLESLGVPRRLTGSHSLRRGGASLYAMFMPDSEVKKFGRWESDAYKLYIHLENAALEVWLKQAAKAMPRFELN